MSDPRSVGLCQQRHPKLLAAGKPTDNGFILRQGNSLPDCVSILPTFNSTLRSECLNTCRHRRSDPWRTIDYVMSTAGTREKPDNRRQHHNKDRPHSAIAYNLPIVMHDPRGAASPSP